MWERKRSRLGLHTKSFKSSEALGAVMYRAVNWSWHSTVEKRTQNVQACQRHKRWGSGCRAEREREHTQTASFLHLCWKAAKRSLCVGVFIRTHTHTCAPSHAAVPYIQSADQPLALLPYSCAHLASLLQFEFCLQIKKKKKNLRPAYMKSDTHSLKLSILLNCCIF